MRNIFIGLICILFFECSSNTSLISEKFKNGDIIFQVSQSRQCKAVQIATNSKYSHVGIIYFENDKPFVYEAVQPVKVTPLENWIKRGEGNHFVVKRLKNRDEILTPSVLNNMKSIGEKYLGKDYDLYFEWTDDRIYCSELVWKIYKEGAAIEIGTLEKMKDFNLKNELVQTILKERYGENIPMEETVISPVSILNSANLDLVYSN